MSIPPPDPPPGTARDELALTGAAPTGAVGHLPADWSGPEIAHLAQPRDIGVSFLPDPRRGRLARQHAHLLASAERVRQVVVHGKPYPTAEDRLRDILGVGFRDPGIPDGGRRTP